MKLKIGDKVYLQKYEVAHIMRDLDGFPGDVLIETFDANEDGFFFMGGLSDGFRFECVYQKPENVKWLMERDWIIDYDEYAEMPLAELEAIRKQLETECSAEINEFNAKDEAYKKAHFNEESDKVNKLSHKITSLGYIIGFRKSRIKFVFPDEYASKTTTSTPKKKPGFFKRLFSRGAQ